MYGGLLASPDGICIYDSQEGEGEYEGRRVVRLLIDGEWVIHPLHEPYIGDYETDDSCIFCGHPSERK